MSLKGLVVKSLKSVENALDINFAEKIVKKLINNKIEPIAKVKELKIDNKLKVISAKILLKGEERAINITIEKYNISDNNEYIVIRKTDTNKEWLKEIIERYVLDKTFEIPKKYREYLNYLK